MTVTATSSRAEYLGNGVTTVFAYRFRIKAATDLEVTRRVVATGVATTLSYLNDYTVSGVGNRTGGSVTLTVALPTGSTLVIRRVLDITQPANLRNQGAYYPENIEDALDRGTMIDQQLNDGILQSFRLPDGVSGVSTVMPSPLANQILMWDPTATFLTSGIISTAAVVLPGAGRTVTDLTSYLANNADINVQDFGAIGNGIHDDYPNITTARDVALTQGRKLIFPPGRYFYNTDFDFTVGDDADLTPTSLEVRGVPGRSWLCPGPAVQISCGLTTGRNAFGTTNLLKVSGLGIDGGATTMATGWLVGDNANLALYTSGNILMEDCAAVNFLGLGARGLHVQNAVSCRYVRCYFGFNTTGGYQKGGDPGGSLPTAQHYINCSFREAGNSLGGATGGVGIGFHLIRGYMTTFDGCVFEANYGDGLLSAQSPVVALTTIPHCWFEANQRALPASARWQAAHITSSGGSALQIEHAQFGGPVQAIRMTSTVNSYIGDIAVPRIQRVSTSLTATATGYHRSDGGDFTTAVGGDGFAVGQRINARNWLSSTTNNQYATITAVTASDITCTGTTTEAWNAGTAYVFGDVVLSGGVAYSCILAHTNQVPPNATYWIVNLGSRSLTVVFVSIDAACIGAFGPWQHNNVPVDVIENLAPAIFNGWDTYAYGVLYIDPLTKALLPATSNQVAFGKSAARIKEMWISSVLDVLGTGSFAGNVFAAAYQGILGAPVIVQPRVGQYGTLRDNASAEALKWDTTFVKSLKDFWAAKHMDGAGLQLLTSRQPAIADIATADATDLPTAIALANANKAKTNAVLAMLRVHGVIAP